MCIGCSWGRYLTIRPASGRASVAPSRRYLLRAGATLGAAAALRPIFEATDATAQSATPGSPTSVNVVFRNGAIYTVNPTSPWAEAVVVRGKHIIHVGSETEALKLAGAGARIVDLKGRMLLPGFVEGHTHPLVGSAIARGI